MKRLICLIALAWLAAASTAVAQDYDKGWLDVNFGATSPAEESYTSVRLRTISQEIARAAVAYSLPRGGLFDIGGGYKFNPRVGIGISLSGAVHEDSAGLAISIPHPIIFNAFASDATTTDGVLRRTEGAFHIQAMVVVAQSPRVRLRVFGGPSHFGVEQDTISFIGYDQVYQVFGRGNSVNITNYTTDKSEGSAWGVHGGFDVSAFFSRVVGIGGELRVSRATVDIDDYGGPSEAKAGGVQYGGGLRLRF